MEISFFANFTLNGHVHCVDYKGISVDIEWMSFNLMTKHLDDIEKFIILKSNFEKSTENLEFRSTSFVFSTFFIKSRLKFFDSFLNSGFNSMIVNFIQSKFDFYQRMT